MGSGDAGGRRREKKKLSFESVQKIASQPVGKKWTELGERSLFQLGEEKGNDGCTCSRLENDEKMRTWSSLRWSVGQR